MNKKVDAEYLKGYKEFIRKIDERYYCDKVQISGDIVSAYDMVEALRNKFGKYNNVFFKKYENTLKRFNRRNGFTSITYSKKRRMIGNIGFYVDESGYYYCKLYYVDEYGKVCGIGIVDNSVKLDACDDEANVNKKELMQYLRVLSDFATKNPGMSFRWDKLNPQVEKFDVGDDFLKCTINLYDLDMVQPYFARSVESDKYACFDHEYANKVVSQCGDAFLKRMSVNLNDVNERAGSIISDTVRKAYGLVDTKLVR